jgi:hypothetical protein
MTEDNKGNAKISADLLKQIKTLTKGDLVHLSWNHDYVTTVSGNGKFTSKSPERPVTELVKITQAEADALKEKAAVKAPDLTVTGTVPATLNSFNGIAHVMVYEYHPMLADAPATLLDSKDVPLTHVRGTATAVKAVFDTIKTEEQRKYYTVVNVYSDKGKTTRVMGTGEFGKIFTKGVGETRALKLVPVKK